MDKRVDLQQLKRLIDDYQNYGKKVVWTNGCFDILHVGHVTYLEEARSLGDILVLGLNSDRSVRRNKGDFRPIFSEEQRAKVLGALLWIDHIVIFDDPSPIELLRFLKPDIYAKGGDYTIDTIDQEERHVVEGYEGEIKILPIVDGVSTTEIADKISRITSL